MPFQLGDGIIATGGDFKPMCYVERTDSDDYRDWRYEYCDVPICDKVNLTSSS